MVAVLPENILRLMTPAQRKLLGKGGITAEEAIAIATAKSESQLQSQIENFLKLRGIFPIRQRMDRKSNVSIGTPDILFAVAGHAVAWEIKMPGKHPKPEQLKAMEHMGDPLNGWHCSVVRSYDEAIGIFNQLLTQPEKP